MMSKRYLFMIAASAAIILAASCSNEQEESPLANVEIQLRADVDNIMMATRAATDIQGSQFAYTEGSPELINIEIIDAKIKADGTAASEPVNPTRASYIFQTTATAGELAPIGTKPYFPGTGNKVNIYAYYPATVGTVGSTVTCVLPAEFAVQTDQSTTDGYKASDLMYAEPASNPVARTEESIPLPFAHKLSKIVVQLKGDGNGVQTSDLVGATVTMKAMTSAPVSTACVATSQTWTSADATDVNMGTVAVNADDDAIYETAAIVVPQTIAANSADVFTITLTNGSVYQYTPAKALTIAATTAYQFVFTLSRTAVSVTTAIIDWDDSEDAVNLANNDGTTLGRPLGPPAGIEAVDLGLPSGTKWANMNVGATSETDYGLYFMWGDIVGYSGNNTEGTANDNYSFDDSNYKWINDDGSTFTRYTGSDYTVLLPVDDAATANWGSGWRMPTEEEVTELVNTFNDNDFDNNNSTHWKWEWLENYKGVSDCNGWLISYRASTDNTTVTSTLFLPAAAYRNDTYVMDQGYSGYYWSSTLDSYDPYIASLLFFHGGYGSLYMYPRSWGCTVRPVQRQ